jgi:LAS superfamily LD-carboxypeptidase LdcB/putative cell wall-binding protein
MRRLTLIALAAVLAAGAVVAEPPSPARAAMTVQRLAGTDRYATAAAVSAAHFAPGVPAAFVATGANFPDALAGGPAAARNGAPILLVTADGIPHSTAAELARLRPGRIVVLGGTGVVSDAVMAALDAYDAGGGVTRLAGLDRYETAAAVSAATFAPGAPIAVVAFGGSFPDALVGGVAAARLGGPVLLTRTNELPAATDAELRRLAPARIVVVGGAGVVSDAALAALAGYAAGGATRLGGVDRYATAVAVSAGLFPGAASLFVATGRNFADALVAVPPAAIGGGALLIVPGGSAPPAVRAEAARLRPGRLVLLGGPAVVNDRVTFDLRVALGDLRPLPACAYQDVATPLQAYGDWQRTLLDTTLMVPPSYAPPDLVDTRNAGLNGGYAVRQHVIGDLAAMAAGAAAAGAPIQLASGYRSYAAQQATFNHWVAVGGYEQALRTSARPGHSEHQLGTTVDVTSRGGRPPWEYADWGATPAGAWMAANAWRYGFVLSYPRGAGATVCYDHEPWHWRYFGREVAAQIRASGLTPREWLWLNGSGG